MARKAQIGDRLHVVVDPDSNGGAELAPADVVHVHRDGKVNVRAHLNTAEGSRLIAGVDVYDSREELESALDAHRALLPGEHRHNPGAEREPWRQSDVYRWVQAACWPVADAGRHAAPVDAD